MGVEGWVAFVAARGGRFGERLPDVIVGLLRLLLACVVVVVVAGCNGGTVDRHALTNDSATLDSIACEGALLAGDVGRGRTTTYFAREQAEELRIQSSNFADALSRRKALSSIVRRVREEARHAAVLAAVLQRLHDHPSDRAVGVAVAIRLKKLGSCP
jgi:CRP-like cAMP-binding protein